jgi:hypothetical protein
MILIIRMRRISVFSQNQKKTPLGDGAKKPILRSPIKSPVF